MTAQRFQLLSLQPCAKGAALLAALTFVSIAHAIDVPKVHITDTVPLEQVTDIRSQPLALLSKYPEGGPPMAQYVAQEIIKDPTMVDPILSVANDTSPQQAAAIGAGLVRGARAIEAEHPEAARMIAEKVTKSDNLRIKVSFQSIGPGYVLEADLRPIERPQSQEIASNNTDDTGRRKVLPKPQNDIEQFESRHSKSDEVFLDRHNDLSGRDLSGGESGNNLLSPRMTEVLARDGTIIAIVASDATRNGAASTSPTR